MDIRGVKGQAGFRRRFGGAAAVEFVALAPLVLVLSGVIWDLRDYVSHRTDLAREVFVVAQVISNRSDTNLVEPMAAAFADRFAGSGAGSIDVAVVARGTEQPGGGVCIDPYDETAADRFCRPRVLRRWPEPANAQDGLWAERCPATNPSCVAQLGGNGCQQNGVSRSLLPAQGDHFGAGMTVLRNEGAGGLAEAGWLSRDFNDFEWWVVVDVCLEPGPGLFTGRLIHAGMQALDFSDLTLGLRGAWRSLQLLNECIWCEP
ncbi:MAG: hypothetical protein OXJ53_01335 [Gammaproteobacteria bacterium]|nr:hypothetical protein [Gammaproteobacteria bacterium]MDE0271176.1 hypothetical protein [Gammaproteobacteria bacterium]